MTAAPHVRSLALMHRLLYGDLRHGYALLWVQRQSVRSVDWGRVLVPVWDLAAWMSAVLSADRQGLAVLAQPYAFLRDPGLPFTGFDPHHWYQATVVLTWSAPPTAAAVTDLGLVGGRVFVTRRGTHVGLLRLARPRPVGSLEALGEEIARGLGAVADPRRRLPIPGICGARFVPVAQPVGAAS
jgi:hypothetical protein